MVHAKNSETASAFVKVIQRKLMASFFPDTVYGTRYETAKTYYESAK